MTGFSKSQGFTLLELLVALSILSVVVILVASLITRLTFMQRREIGEQALQENVRLALEVLSREARLAYASTFAIADGEGQSVVMRNQNGLCVGYRLNTERARLERAEAAFPGADCLGAPLEARYVALTGERIEVAAARFDIPDNVYNLADDRLDRQGFLTLMVSARARAGGAPLHIQTTVTSRQTLPYTSL